MAILALLEAFKANLGQPNQLERDVKDSTEIVVVFEKTVKEFRLDGRFISIEQGDWWVDRVVLPSPRKELVKHLKPLYI